jgi:uncharacterized membrane protein
LIEKAAAINHLEPQNESTPEEKTRFRWHYIALPAALFLLSLVLAACFFPFLSNEIAYHFQNDAPDRWLSRGAFIGWMIIPQVFFTLLAISLVRMVMASARFFPAGATPLNYLLPLMGNMVGLPQIVLTIAMLDFFLYNTHQISLLPLWAITLIVLVVGAIVLAALFMRIIRRYRQPKKVKTNQE